MQPAQIKKLAFEVFKTSKANLRNNDAQIALALSPAGGG